MELLLFLDRDQINFRHDFIHHSISYPMIVFFSAIFLYPHQPLRHSTTTWHGPSATLFHVRTLRSWPMLWVERSSTWIKWVTAKSYQEVSLQSVSMNQCISCQAPGKCCVCLLCFSLFVANVLSRTSRTIAAWRASITKLQPHPPSEVYQRLCWFVFLVHHIQYQVRFMRMIVANHVEIGNTLLICFLNVSLHRKTVVVLYQARTFIYLWIVDRLWSIVFYIIVFWSLGCNHFVSTLLAPCLHVLFLDLGTDTMTVSPPHHGVFCLSATWSSHMHWLILVWM